MNEPLQENKVSEIPSAAIYMQPCGLLSNPDIIRLIASIGDWWDQPASRSGKWHRPNQTQWGHSLGVLNNAIVLWNTLPDELRKDEGLYDDYLTAAIFHDIGKTINFELHDFWSGVWLKDREYAIAGAIATLHMGRWGSKRAIKNAIGFPTEVLVCGELLATADYMDAMQHFRQNEICNPSWRELK